MASISSSYANKLNRCKQAVSGAATHKEALPAIAAKHAEGVTADVAEAEKLNAHQETLKSELKAVTKKLNAKLAAANTKRTKIVKLAEATFGVNGPEMQAFRSKTEGKT